MYKKITLFFIFLNFIFVCSEGCSICPKPGVNGIKIWADHPKPHKHWKPSFAIRLSPAFFWQTIALEMEYAFSKNLTIGTNLFAKVGRMDGRDANFKIKNEPFLEDGYRAELFLNYYFKKEAQEGLYMQLIGGYNKILYFDGNTRPYTLHNHWKDLDGGVRTAIDLDKPKPFVGGLGIGYQMVIIPKHVVGNIIVGVMGNIDQDDTFFFTVYLSPTIGIKF